MQCGICGRKLKSQKSIERGVGSVCWAKVHPTKKKLPKAKMGDCDSQIIIEEIPGQMHITDFI